MLWEGTYEYFFKVLLLIHLGIYLEVELLDHLVIIFILFWQTAMLFYNIYTVLNSYQQYTKIQLVYFFSLSFSLIVVTLRRVRWYLKVVSIFISLTIVILCTFHVLIGSFVWLFWKNVYSISLPIFQIELFGIRFWVLAFY
jgi:hypothetical protein